MAELHATDDVRVGREQDVAAKPWFQGHGHDQAMEKARGMGAPFMDSTIRLCLAGYGGAGLRSLAVDMLAINAGWGLALEQEDLDALQGLLELALEVEDAREVCRDASAS